jgi:hypothetical protein
MLLGSRFFLFIVSESLLLLFLMLHGFQGDAGGLQAKRATVKALNLTDFAIWTEARYTRHPSQTDFFSAFQDLPGGVDHFPAGSVIGPTTPEAARVP